MRWIVGLVGVVACAPAELGTSEAPPPPTVTLTAPEHLVLGEPNVFEVSGSLAAGERVYLLGASQAGDGACSEVVGGNCIGLLAPVRVLGEGFYDGGAAEVTWTPPAGMAAGRSLSFQAVVIRGMRGVDTGLSAVETLSTEAPAPGCTDWTASNYDAAANIDDGSCHYPCPGGAANITSQADVALYEECVVLSSVALHQNSGVTNLSLPNLVQVTGDVYFHQNVNLQTVSMPMLQSVGRYVYFHQNLALQTIDMGSLQTVGEYLYLHGNTAVTSADFSSVASVGGYVYFNGNSSWCVPHDVDWNSVHHQYFHSAGNACN